MATLVWRGDAQPRAKVMTFTVGGTVANGDTVTVTMNRKEAAAVAVVPSDTAATLAAKLYDALLAAADAEFGEVTWSYPGTGAVVTGTAATAGVPFAAAAAATGTTTLTAATPVAGKGPAHLSDPDNYSTGNLPVNGDTLVFEADAPPCLYDLDALSAVNLAALVVRGGEVGLPDRNPAGYYEYRPRDLLLGQCAALTVTGTPDRVRVAVAGGSSAARVEAGGGAAFAGTADPAVRLSGAATFATLAVVSGDVGVAVGTGEAATVTALTVGTLAAANAAGATDEDARVRLGAGAAVAAAALYGGTVEGEASGANLTVAAGTWRQAAGNVGTIACTGGTVDYRGSGTVGAATFKGEDALFDLSGDARAVTVASLSVTAGARLVDPHKRVGSLAFVTDKESLAASELGETFTVTRS